MPFPDGACRRSSMRGLSRGAFDYSHAGAHAEPARDARDHRGTVLSNCRHICRAVGSTGSLRAPHIRPAMALIVLSARRVPLREKARWYLDKGVGVVRLLFPKEREVVVVTRADESRRRMGERLPADPRLPDLAPRVDELFA